jgi:hypothetical protein
VLSIVNRPGNRPSHEGAAEQLDLYSARPDVAQIAVSRPWA